VARVYRNTEKGEKRRALPLPCHVLPIDRSSPPAAPASARHGSHGRVQWALFVCAYQEGPSVEAISAQEMSTPWRHRM
jgi:hypothetical protein